jgi:hypothetical protein
LKPVSERSKPVSFNSPSSSRQKSLATPAPSEPNTITAANLEQAWGRSADNHARSLGITPVTDAEAAKIQEAMNAAVAKKQAEQAAQMDD